MEVTIAHVVMDFIRMTPTHVFLDVSILTNAKQQILVTATRRAITPLEVTFVHVTMGSKATTHIVTILMNACIHTFTSVTIIRLVSIMMEVTTARAQEVFTRTMKTQFILTALTSMNAKQQIPVTVTRRAITLLEVTFVRVTMGSKATTTHIVTILMNACIHTFTSVTIIRLVSIMMEVTTARAQEVFTRTMKTQFILTALTSMNAKQQIPVTVTRRAITLLEVTFVRVTMGSKATTHIVTILMNACIHTFTSVTIIRLVSIMMEVTTARAQEVFTRTMKTQFILTALTSMNAKQQIPVTVTRRAITLLEVTFVRVTMGSKATTHIVTILMNACIHTFTGVTIIRLVSIMMEVTTARAQEVFTRTRKTQFILTALTSMNAKQQIPVTATRRAITP